MKVLVACEESQEVCKAFRDEIQGRIRKIEVERHKMIKDLNANADNIMEQLATIKDMSVSLAALSELLKSLDDE